MRGGFMRKYLQFGFIALAMALPLPATAQVATPVSATKAQTPASVLAALLSKEERQLGQLVPMIDSFFVQLKLSTPEVAELSEEYPGLEQVWKDAMMPVLIDEVRASLPEYRAELTEFFGKHFSPAELTQLNRFWASPLGQQLLESASNALSFSQISKELAKEIENENLDVSKAAYEKDKGAAVARTVRALSPAQRAELGRFEQSPVGQKFVRFKDQKQQIDLRYFNKEPTPEATARIEKQVGDAIERHMAEVDRQRSAETAKPEQPKK
jgi:hypothetical protein